MLTRLLHAFASHPRGYDLIQFAAGATQTSRVLREHMAYMGGSTVLDVGAGTGSAYTLLPEGTPYIWLDNDPKKLAGFQARFSKPAKILGDAVHLPLRSRCVDYVTVLAVVHHIPDMALPQFFTELARIPRKGLFVCDPVATPSSLRSKLLWRYDQGSFPRTPETLRAKLEPYFVIERFELFRVHHRYAVCVASPREKIIESQA